MCYNRYLLQALLLICFNHGNTTSCSIVRSTVCIFAFYARTTLRTLWRIPLYRQRSLNGDKKRLQNSDNQTLLVLPIDSERTTPVHQHRLGQTLSAKLAAAPSRHRSRTPPAPANAHTSGQYTLEQRIKSLLKQKNKNHTHLQPLTGHRAGAVLYTRLQDPCEGRWTTVARLGCAVLCRTKSAPLTQRMQWNHACIPVPKRLVHTALKHTIQGPTNHFRVAPHSLFQLIEPPCF